MASDLPRRPAVYTFAAGEAARISRKAGAGVMKPGARGPAIVALAMPLPWMAEGFLRAVLHFEDADLLGVVETKDGCIPLFEALSWLHAIIGIYAPPIIEDNSDVRALRFIRNRQHHHKAAPIRRGQDVDQFIWASAATIPEPRRDAYDEGEEGQQEYERHLDKKGERVYSNQLADKPVSKTLQRLARRIATLLA
jgi:hypothetical protein